MDHLGAVYEAMLVDQVRPAFVRANAEWLLSEEEVIETIVETDGDTAWLALDLNLQADICVLEWMSETLDMSAPQVASFRRYALALKAAAAALSR